MGGKMGGEDGSNRWSDHLKLTNAPLFFLPRLEHHLRGQSDKMVRECWGACALFCRVGVMSRGLGYNFGVAAVLCEV